MGFDEGKLKGSFWEGKGRGVGVRPRFRSEGVLAELEVKFEVSNL